MTLLSDLADLFHRDFFVGYFIPAALFVSAVVWIADAYDVPAWALSLQSGLEGIWNLGTTILAAWLLAVLLLAMNRTLVRGLEGYSFRRFRLLTGRQVRRYHRLNERVARLSERYLEEARGNALRPQTEQVYMCARLEQRIFPPHENLLLPTTFGNVVRAFEVYPYTIYGADLIAIWPRLLALVPDRLHDSIGASKAELDFAVNLVYLGVASAVAWLGLAIGYGEIRSIWILVIALGVAFAAYRMAISAAVVWGELITAAFDLYRLDLLHQMGWEEPETNEQERRCWGQVSRMFQYRESGELPSPEQRRKPSTTN